MQFYLLDIEFNSKNATLFRKWATNVLKEYMLKGYAVNNGLGRAFIA